jgi:hydrogenase maturation protease
VKARVVGFGQWRGGDDAVGLEVVRALAPIEGVEVREAVEPSELVELAVGVDLVVVVDAVVGAGERGSVVRLEPEQLGRARTVSTHGIDVPTALALARATGREPARVAIVGVAIDTAERGAVGLSPAVARAVPRAVEMVRAILGELAHA